MAYQPKYAQAKALKPAPRKQEQPMEAVFKEPRKIGRKMLILQIPPSPLEFLMMKNESKKLEKSC